MKARLQNALKRIPMPHTLVIVEGLVVLVLLLSWILPSGAFTRVPLNGRMVPDPATFHVLLPKVRLGPGALSAWDVVKMATADGAAALGLDAVGVALGPDPGDRFLFLLQGADPEFLHDSP